MLLARLALVVALVVSAAGCQGSSGQTVGAKQWVGELCVGISDWQAGLQDVPNASGNPDLVKLKDAMVSFLDSLVRNTDRLIERVEKAGIPDIPSGSQAASDFKAAFGGMQASFRNAKSTIDAAPTNDQSKFAASLTKVGEVLKGSIEAAGKAFGNISTKYPDLGKAAKDVSSCNSTAK